MKAILNDYEPYPKIPRVLVLFEDFYGVVREVRFWDAKIYEW